MSTQTAFSSASNVVGATKTPSSVAFHSRPSKRITTDELYEARRVLWALLTSFEQEGASAGSR